VDRTDVVLRKYDGRLHRWVTGYRLGSDDFGTWLGTPAGTTVHYNYGTRGIGTTQHDAVRLIPRDGWWIAMFTPAPDERAVYCDICLPPTWTSGTEVTVIDLDLDLSRFRTGQVTLEDEDEFAANEAVYGYPPDVVAAAKAAADTLLRALSRHEEPFGTHWENWIPRLAGLPPV
jgi:protein associated with RNAse G/E